MSNDDAGSISPLAPLKYPALQEMQGVKFSSAEAGIKYQNRHDVLLVQFDPLARVAGVVTRSRCPSAPVEWCKSRLSRGKARALLVNSGNANAFTGQKGVAAAQRSAELVGKYLDCSADDVFLASTGVIGEPLVDEKFSKVIENLVREGGSGSQDWELAARTIMTTDTFPKLSTRSVNIGDRDYQISGIAKGAGMIQPDMATMLSFIFTDIPITANLLQEILSRQVITTFNAITVDSDTSTSDTVLLFSVGNREPLTDADHLIEFERKLKEVMLDLALQVVCDGEGARKLVEVSVEGAENYDSAKKIAFSIANSPLVKTAIAGEDANWGRIVMAVGKAGEPADRDQLNIWFGDVQVATDGERSPGYSESAASEVMRREKITIRVDVGVGDGQAKVWTCDLTKDYIAINGDYRS